MYKRNNNIISSTVIGFSLETILLWLNWISSGGQANRVYLKVLLLTLTEVDATLCLKSGGSDEPGVLAYNC